MTESIELPRTNVVFELSIPRSWDEIDLKPSTRDRSIKNLVDSRIEALPQLRPRRADLVRYVRDLASDAWDSGARYCASFAKPAGDGVIMGSLTVNILPPVPGAAGSVLDRVVESLHTARDKHGDGLWRNTVTETLEGAGTVVRTFGIQEAKVDRKGTTVRFAFLNTFVPLENAVMLVSCASPAVDVADALFDLFSSVSNTLVITRDDEVS